jgi:predicted DNA-binding protein (MmcQ/YjbR family)
MNAYPWLYDYLAEKPGATSDFKAEWQWTRYMVDGKMFAAICKDGAGDDIVTLKLEPTEGELMRAAFPTVKPGYYMDKRHWNSVTLDGALPDDVLRDICDKSHALILAKLSKRRQAEIFGANPPNSHI